jgi:hypothetical protein
MKTQNTAPANGKHNPVARVAHQFNRCRVMRDRKAAAKRGYQKHKGGW